jgi:tetratricopeptide (TPR) repeat protein
MAGHELAGDPARAESLYNDVARVSSDRGAAALAKLKLLSLRVDKGQPGEVLAALDEMQSQLDEIADSGALAEAALQRARVQLASRNFRQALEAALSVIVFYPDEVLSHAPATLLAARASFGLDDLVRARMYLEDLTNTYPQSPELAAAKEDFARLERREGKKLTPESTQTP